MIRQNQSDFSLLLNLKEQGYEHIVGLDEVGRGALAGPLVVAAVELNVQLDGIADSKKLTALGRDNLFGPIVKYAVQLSFGQVSNNEIDTLGLARALRLAYQRALVSIRADLLLTDAYPIAGQKYIKAIKGDQLFYPTAAASIVAKVYRDQIMKTYHQVFPGYGWEKNVGYGSAFHLAKIRKSGLTPVHRHSFILKRLTGGRRGQNPPSTGGEAFS